MVYLKVTWVHEFDDEPFLLYSELDKNRSEIRKIEIYKDGSFGIATTNFEFGGTMLSKEPIPSIEDIKEDSQFLPCIITEYEFEEIWLKYKNYLK
jgi:hypothetical protein